MEPKTFNLIGLAFGVLALLSALSGYVLGTSSSWTPLLAVISVFAICVNIYALRRMKKNNVIEVVSACIHGKGTVNIK